MSTVTLSHRARRAIRLRNVAQILLLEGRIGRARWAEFLAVLLEAGISPSAIQSARHAARGRHVVKAQHRHGFVQYPQGIRVRPESLDGHAVLVRGA